MRLWHIAALVGAGLVVGLLHVPAMGAIFQYATLGVFLPAIIFEAAWQLDARIMVRAWKPIALLALPGVAITAAIITASLNWLGGVALGTAGLIGVALCATDPVSVVAIFRRLPVPRELATIVESESLLNDAVAVAFFQVAILFAAGYVWMEPAARFAIFIALVASAAASIVIGIIAGTIASAALRASVPTWLQTLATIVCAYAIYFVADLAHLSGIFAVIAAAVTMREMERRFGSIEAARGVELSWHALATGANAVLFFLIGAAVSPHDLWAQRYVLIATMVGLAIARAVLAYGMLSLVPKMLSSWRMAIALAGVRGALSLALVLSLSPSIPQRQTAVDVTFVVVVVSILIGTLAFERPIAGLALGAEED